MKVILQENIKSLGKKGDIVEVKDSYFRNFLAKRNLAIVADSKNINELNNNKASMRYKDEQDKKAAEELKNKIDNEIVTFEMKVGETSKLFGSISEKDVLEAINSKFALKLDKKVLKMKENIKSLGFTNVELKLYEGVEAKIRVEVKAKK